MNKPKTARLTGDLLARKGDAKPAASVIDFNVTNMFNHPVEVPRDTTYEAAVQQAASRYSDGSPIWEEATPYPALVDPEYMPDPEALLRQLVGHMDYQPLDSTGTPADTESAEVHALHQEPKARISRATGKRQALTVRLEADQYQQFKELAEDTGLSNQEMLTDAVDEYLDHAGPELTNQKHAKPKFATDAQVSELAAELGIIRAMLENLTGPFDSTDRDAEPPYTAN